MITVISSTNRVDSNSKIVSKNLIHLIEKQGFDSGLLCLEDLPREFGLPNAYGVIPESFKQDCSTYIETVDRFIFVIPEYNGSFPGVVKLFLDTLPPEIWEGKKAALVGVASGRAGNLRGLDHFTAVLNYLKVEVLSKKIPLSSIHECIDERGKISSQEYLTLLAQQITSLVKF
ncbi:MAG: NAD(P)H-dependent oxidoreductase [Flavobacteriales bacterium]|nr:NAD(P)H-dependent oxidoreductase [Flavobacteriales bacterium]